MNISCEALRAFANWYRFSVQTFSWINDGAFSWLPLWWGWENCTWSDNRLNGMVLPIIQSSTFASIESYFIYSHLPRQWPTIRYCFMPLSAYYSFMRWTDNTENYSHSMNKTLPIYLKWRQIGEWNFLELTHISAKLFNRTCWNLKHISYEIYY